MSARGLVSAFECFGGRVCFLLYVLVAFGLKKASCASRVLYAAAAVALLVGLGFCVTRIVKRAVRVTCLPAVLWPSFSAFTSRRHLCLSFAIMISERQEFETGTSMSRSPSLRLL